MLLSEIIDHRTDRSEAQIEDGFTKTRGRGKCRVRITKCWEIGVC